MSDSILMTMPGLLQFTKDGVWLHDGSPITHRGVSLFFSKRLKYSEEHACYIVEDSGRCVKVSVEDTPRVVVTIDTTTEPWKVIFNCETTEPFSPDCLRYSPQGELYYIAKADQRAARLLRPAVQAISPHLNESSNSFIFQFHGLTTNIPPLQLVRPYFPR